MVKLLQHWPSMLVLLAFQWIVPARLFVWLKAFMPVQSETQAADLLEAWSALLPPFALVSLLFSGLAFGLLCPLLGLVGYIGG